MGGQGSGRRRFASGKNKKGKQQKKKKGGGTDKPRVDYETMAAAVRSATKEGDVDDVLLEQAKTTAVNMKVDVAGVGGVGRGEGVRWWLGGGWVVGWYSLALVRSRCWQEDVYKLVQEREQMPMSGIRVQPTHKKPVLVLWNLPTAILDCEAVEQPTAAEGWSENWDFNADIFRGKTNVPRRTTGQKSFREPEAAFVWMMLQYECVRIAKRVLATAGPGVYTPGTGHGGGTSLYRYDEKLDEQRWIVKGSWRKKREPGKVVVLQGLLVALGYKGKNVYMSWRDEIGKTENGDDMTFANPYECAVHVYGRIKELVDRVPPAELSVDPEVLSKARVGVIMEMLVGDQDTTGAPVVDYTTLLTPEVLEVGVFGERYFAAMTSGGARNGVPESEWRSELLKVLGGLPGEIEVWFGERASTKKLGYLVKKEEGWKGRLERVVDEITEKLWWLGAGSGAV